MFCTETTGGDFLRGPQLFHGDLGQADVADLPFVPQALQLAHLVGEWHGRVDAVELEQVDALQAQVAEAELGLLPQVLRAADRRRQVRALTCEPDLGGDDQAIGVRVQGLLDELLGQPGRTLRRDDSSQRVTDFPYRTATVRKRSRPAISLTK